MEKKLVPHGVITNEVINLNSQIRKVERRHRNPHTRAAAPSRDVSVAWPAGPWPSWMGQVLVQSQETLVANSQLPVQVHPLLTRSTEDSGEQAFGTPSVRQRGNQVFAEGPFRRDCSIRSVSTNATTAPSALCRQTPLPQPSMPWRRQGEMLLLALAPTLKVVLVELIPRALVLGPSKGINQYLLCLSIQSLLWCLLLCSVAH